MIIPKKTIIFFVLIFLWSCDYLEYENNEYSNFEKLKFKSEPGNWIPSLLPESAYNIEESHYVDNPESWGSFEVNNIESMAFLNECSSYSGREIEKVKTRKKLIWMIVDKKRKFFYCKESILFAVEQTDKIIVVYWHWSSSINYRVSRG